MRVKNVSKEIIERSVERATGFVERLSKASETKGYDSTRSNSLAHFYDARALFRFALGESIEAVVNDHKEAAKWYKIFLENLDGVPSKNCSFMIDDGIESALVAGEIPLAEAIAGYITQFPRGNLYQMGCQESYCMTLKHLLFREDDSVRQDVNSVVKLRNFAQYTVKRAKKRGADKETIRLLLNHEIEAYYIARMCLAITDSNKKAFSHYLRLYLENYRWDLELASTTPLWVEGRRIYKYYSKRGIALAQLARTRGIYITESDFAGNKIFSRDRRYLLDYFPLEMLNTHK